MKSAIDELILKNPNFMESIKPNKKYFKLSDENNNIYLKLKETLNKEQIELLDKLIFNNVGMEAESSECFLLHGFKTGLKLIIESL